MSASEWQVVELSLKAAALGAAVDVPLAMGLAWLLVKRRVRGRMALEALAMLPLALPPVVSGYFLLLVFGAGGLGGPLERIGVRIVFTWVAAGLAAAVVGFPLMLRAIMTAMGNVDFRLEQAARNLGASPARVFFTITLPLAYRGVLAGILLAFVRGLGEFGATVIVAGNIPGRTQTLPLAIYQGLQLGDSGMVARLAGISVVLAIASLLVHNYLLERSLRRREA